MRTSQKSRILSASQKLYRILLYAYPAEHRHQYGPLMAQLFNDLCRDAYQRSGLPALASLWMRTLRDLLTTATSEHVDALRKGFLPQMQNRPLIPVSWPKVGLAILPGLLVIGIRSGFLADTLGVRAGRVLMPGGLLALCALLVAIGLVLERKLAVWSFPALGILFFGVWWFGVWWLALPVTAFCVYQAHKRRNPRSPRPNNILVSLLGLVLAVDFFLLVLSDHNPDKLTAVFAGLSSFLLWISLLPVAAGLPLAQREGLLAGLFVVAAQFMPFSDIFDPSYAIGIWTSSQVLITAVEVIPALGSLVAVPIWVLRCRSTCGQIWGLLLSVFVTLVSSEAIYGAPRPYYADIWTIRAIGILQFVTASALAAVLYATNHHDGSPTPGQHTFAPCTTDPSATPFSR
jgi:hypothetical protein